MEFQIGSPIFDKSGERLGTLKHVIVDQETDQVVEIVLGESGLLGREVLVPTGAIDEADDDGIRLEMDKDQAESLKDFVVTSYVAPPPDTYAAQPWGAGALIGQGMAPVGAATGLESIAYTPLVETEEQIAPGDVDIQPGTEVWDTSQKIGTVKEVFVDEGTRRVSGLVVQTGFLFHKDTRISKDQIANIGADRITLSISKDDLERSAGSG